MSHTHQDHKTFLNKHRAVITEWNRYTQRTTINQPRGAQPVCGIKTVKCAGFFTPFTEEHMGFTPSVKGLILMPLLKLQATATHLLEIPLHFIMALITGINGTPHESVSHLGDIFLAGLNALSSFCALILETVKSIVSAITRSIATLMTLEPNSISFTHHPTADEEHYHVHRETSDTIPIYF